MTERSPVSNRFQFVSVASARARQLLRGSVPRVEGQHKVARIAQEEVLTGVVKEEQGVARGLQPSKEATCAAGDEEKLS